MDKVDIAIMRLKEASQMSQQIYGKPLVVTTSGGKDSSVCVSLAEKSGIPFEVLHNHTTADAPETVRFIRREFNRLEAKGIKCTINYPLYKGNAVSMWSLIPMMSIPPTRLKRYCCNILKESSTNNMFIVTGVRWSESVKRKNGRGIYEVIKRNKNEKIILNNDNDEKRTLFESCSLKAKRVCNPIIDWSDCDVWGYIFSENLTVNPLYESGFGRVGCVGCPLASPKFRNREFAIYPKYKKLYLLSFQKMLEVRSGKRKSNGRKYWESPEEVFHWWMEDGVLPGQINLFDEEES